MTFLAGAGCKGLVTILCTTALVSCTTGEARSETSECFPYYTSVGIETVDTGLESTASQVVLDAISSMGYSPSEGRYVTPLQECFITIDRPENSYDGYVRVNLYLSEQRGIDPDGWIKQIQDILMRSIERLGFEDKLEVLQVLHPMRSNAAKPQQP